MAGVTMDAIGFVSSALGIVSFFQENVPNHDPEGSTILIKVGLANEDDPGVGGEFHAAYGFDINNNYLGQTAGEELKLGDTFEGMIDSYSPGTQSNFVGVTTGDDAVCIAWITVSNQNNQGGSAWTGDIGNNCGQNTYFQDEIAGHIKEDGEEKDYIPVCMWLDKDHSGDVPIASMKFSAGAYTNEAAQATVDTGVACENTIYGPDKGPIRTKPGLTKRGEKREKGPEGPRSPKPRRRWMEDRLISSSRVQHTAASLCADENSYGPDFVGSDGMFCDMGTKTLSPLCSTEDVHGCVTVDAEGNRITKRSKIAKRNLDAPHRVYKRTSHWG